MKKLILIAIIIGCSLIADEGLDKLEQSYLSKAETLQADSDKDILARKDKLAKDSKRLAASYLKALKKIEISIVQKGDLDAALLVRAKITEIEGLLKGEAVTVAKHSAQGSIIGKWWWLKVKDVTFFANGTASGTQGHVGTWTKINDITYKAIWDKVSTSIYTLSADNNTLYKHGKEIATRITTNPIVGFWHHSKNKNHIWNFSNDGTIKGTSSGRWKMDGDSTFSIAWHGKGFVPSHTISADGNSLIYKGIIFAKKVTDPFVGTWKSPKMTRNTVTIRKTANGYALNNSLSGNLWTTASIIINGKLVLSWAVNTTLVIESSASGIIYTQYDQKFNGQFPTGKIGTWNKLQLTRIADL